MLTDEEMYARMRNGWRGGIGHGTVCGMGSAPIHSMNIRKALPQWCAKYDIRTVNDAGAGDLVWRSGFDWSVEYRPFDLIPRLYCVTKLDITTQVMPRADMILCRSVLNHLDDKRIAMALDCFRRSGTRFLAATQYDVDNTPDVPTPFQRLDLRKRLGQYLEGVQDLQQDFAKLALWRINSDVEMGATGSLADENGPEEGR